MNNILVLINPQNDYFNGIMRVENPKEVLPKICNMIKDAIATDTPVFVVMDTHTKKYTSTLNGKKIKTLHCIVKTNGWQIEPSINSFLKMCDSSKIKTIQKQAFGSIDLVKELKNHIKVTTDTIKNITIIGSCIESHVLSNAILVKNNFKDIEINVADYACTSYTDIDRTSAHCILKRNCINILKL